MEGCVEYYYSSSLSLGALSRYYLVAAVGVVVAVLYQYQYQEHDLAVVVVVVGKTRTTEVVSLLVWWVCAVFQVA